MGLFRRLIRWLYWRDEDRNSLYPGIPGLVGMRPLENGRIALSFFDDRREVGEIRVYDLWTDFASRRAELPWIERLFDQEFFKSVYVSGFCLCWEESSDLDIPLEYVFQRSVPVKEGFRCLK